MDYLYDGTFEGLLTCVYFHYKKARASGIYVASNYQQTFVNRYEEIITDVGRAKIVCDAVVQYIAFEAFLFV